MQRPGVGADDEDVPQIPSPRPNLLQDLFQGQAGGDRSGGARGPEYRQEEAVDQPDGDEDRRRPQHQGSEGEGLAHLQRVFPQGGEPPGMVELEKGKDQVPGQQESHEDQQVGNLDPHGQHLLEGNPLHLPGDDPGGEEKIEGHGRQVEQLEGIEEYFAAQGGHFSS